VVVLMALSLAAIAVAPLRAVAAVLDALLLVGLGVELARTPSPARLRARRTLPSRAGLSQDLERVLTVVPGRAAGLRLEAREAFPASFEVRARSVPDGRGRARRAGPRAGDPTGGPDVVVLGAADAPMEIVRVYGGSLRGAHTLGDVRLRLTSPWGLLERQARLRGSQEVAVEPALPGLDRTLRLAASERWADLGVRLLRRGGGRLEFESLRDYVPGDDPRLIDWKAFARRGRPMVRQYQIERGQELLLLLDCGRRMRVSSGSGKHARWTKLDHALDAALQLAAVALQKGDRVGALAFDAGVRAWVPPQRGARTMARLLEALFPLRPSGQESDLARALAEVSVRHRRGVLVAILSDAADPLSAGAQERALRLGRGRNRLLFAALDDPTVRALAAGAQPPGSATSAVRAAALQQVSDRRQALRRLERSGARVIDALPAEAAGPLLAAWLDARRRATG
jgi:uncharacterized protein (DUF58 family)